MSRALLPWNETARLAALHSYQILDTHSEDAFDNLLQLAARLTGFPTVLVSLLDKDRQWFKARYGFYVTETSRDMAFCAHAILEPSGAMVVPDATADARFADNPLVTGMPGIRFYAGLPLVNSDGHALGTLCFIDYAPRTIDACDLATLSHLASAVMATIERRKPPKQVQTAINPMDDCFIRIIDALPTALILAGTDGQILNSNRRVERMFGYDHAKLVGQPMELMFQGKVRQQYADLRYDLLSNASGSVADAQALVGLRKDGTEFPLELSLGSIERNGEQMVVAVINDVGPRREIELQRDQHRHELERSNADLEEFANAASHDLRAPLRAISHLADWIGADVDKVGSPETIENLKLLQKRVIRLQTLLDGLLAYSRVGRTDAVTEDVDIGGVVKDVAAMLEMPPGFDVVCEGAMSVIRAHRAPIETVFKNLINNGLQHHNRATGRITVSMRRFDGMAEFRIADDGPGIPKRFHDRIFLVFETLRSRDDSESSGVGLAIVKRHVESNGGTIRVESNPPTRGTTFVFTWSISSLC